MRIAVRYKLITKSKPVSRSESTQKATQLFHRKGYLETDLQMCSEALPGKL